MERPETRARLSPFNPERWYDSPRSVSVEDRNRIIPCGDPDVLQALIFYYPSRYIVEALLAPIATSASSPRIIIGPSTRIGLNAHLSLEANL